MTDDCAQLDLACGYVAARAVNLMYAAGVAWRTVDLSDAAEDTYVELGNELLENWRVEADFLEAQEVLFLTQKFREWAFPDEPVHHDNNVDIYPCMRWPLTVGSRDWIALKLAEALMEYVALGRTTEPSRAFFVTNTEDCSHRGTHWISVAISMRWKDDSDS